MPDLSRAPWTAAEVESLNAYQAAGVMHPFTCGADSSHTLLRATPAGWACPDCDYQQDWAHAFMADGSWRRVFGWRPGGGMLVPASLAPLRAATLAADMCPRCKGDNRESYALCAGCESADA